MSDYRRPTLPTDVYCDEQGHALDYGNRWNEESPPDYAYSRVSNLQRFKPLHAVAYALIEWLQDNFEVSVQQDKEFPGVYLHAGSLHDFHFPECGCDACDDDATNLADELEWTVRTVISGGYSERFDPWPGRWIEYHLDEPGVGMRSGRGRTKDLPDERVRLARTVLPTDGQWLPWQALPPKNAYAVD